MKPKWRMDGNEFWIWLNLPLSFPFRFHCWFVGLNSNQFGIHWIEIRNWNWINLQQQTTSNWIKRNWKLNFSIISFDFCIHSFAQSFAASSNFNKFQFVRLSFLGCYTNHSLTSFRIQSIQSWLPSPFKQTLVSFQSTAV